jgi:hypothetical protein
MKNFKKTINEIINDNTCCPFPIEITSNNMGISLISVDSIEWSEWEDGQLIDLKIKFIPAIEELIKKSMIGEEKLSFESAMFFLKSGYKVRREGWTEEDIYIIRYQSHPVDKYLNTFHDKSSEKTLNGTEHITPEKAGQILTFFMLKTHGDSKYWGEGCSDYVPWTPVSIDIFSDDWKIVK